MTRNKIVLISGTISQLPLQPPIIGEFLDLNLGNKNVLITGSDRGTGNDTAKAFLEEGAKVFVHSLAEGLSESACKELASDLAQPLWGDITTDAGANQVFEQYLSYAHQLDVLVNNYGEARQGKWSTTSTEDWTRLYDINTLSIVRMVQRFLPHLSDSGRIMNLGTIGSTRPNNVMPHYYAAKGALATLTVSLSKEVGPRGITVNLVSPGLIRTPEVESSYLERAKKEGWGDSFEEAEAKITENYFPNPLGRIATRREVSSVVLFLASKLASFVNGQNIRVDGGAVDYV